MKRDLETKNLVQFRLTGTPDGNLLVSFYPLDTFNQEAVNWHIAGLLVENKLNREVLYEGNLQNNTANSKVKTKGSHITLLRCYRFRVGRIFDVWGSPLHYREYTTDQLRGQPRYYVPHSTPLA